MCSTVITARWTLIGVTLTCLVKAASYDIGSPGSNPHSAMETHWNWET